MEGYYRAGYCQAKTPEDHELILSAWRIIAEGFTFNSQTKKQEKYVWTVNERELFQGRLKRYSAGEKHHYLLYGRNLEGVAGYMRCFFGNDVKINEKSWDELFRAVANLDYDTVVSISSWIIHQSQYKTHYLSWLGEAWDEIANMVNQRKAISGDFAAAAKVGEYYFGRSSTDEWNEHYYEAWLEEALS